MHEQGFFDSVTEEDVQKTGENINKKTTIKVHRLETDLFFLLTKKINGF
jgi:hypothetical protein